jgi:hypothetical protein
MQTSWRYPPTISIKFRIFEILKILTFTKIVTIITILPRRGMFHPSTTERIYHVRLNSHRVGKHFRHQGDGIRVRPRVQHR